MKLNKIILIFLILITLCGIFYYQNYYTHSQNTPNPKPVINVINQQSENTSQEQITVIAENLNTPWAIEMLNENEFLITEREGKLLKISATPKETTVQNVYSFGESGLMGMALHPNFEANRYIYFALTYQNAAKAPLNKVVRYKLTDNFELIDEKIIIDRIPGAVYHDGGRIKFGPDGYLYITTGDAGTPNNAQNLGSLAGKILRLTDEGKIPSSNPFGSAIYSFGHRNPQGITWDTNNQMWSTEHGPSGVQTGNDELNSIIIGANYGWPEIKGTQTSNGMRSPIIESGTQDTWAPSGMAIHNDIIYFTGLKGEAIYSYNPSKKIFQTHAKNQFGRIRDIIFDNNNNAYIITNNTDGRGQPKENDDKLIKIPVNLLVEN